MADIELVIKISEDEYNIAKYGQYGNINVDTVRKAIANGTLLPKGHGRLVECEQSILDKIRKEIERLDGKYLIGDYGIYGENIPKYVRLWDVLQIIDKYKESEECKWLKELKQLRE